MEVIRLENISKSYNDNIIIDNYNLIINNSEFIMLVGESGCGKSTLLNIMALIEKPDAGIVMYKGEEISDKTMFYRENLSYVFQNNLLIKNESVRENLRIALNFNCKGKAKQDDKIIDVLTRLGIEGLIDKVVYQLSGGEQQRVAIARAILKDSQVVICDEPTGALDEANTNIIMELLKQLNNEGKTIVMVTHNPQLYKYATRVVEITSNR